MLLCILCCTVCLLILGFLAFCMPKNSCALCHVIYLHGEAAAVEMQIKSSLRRQKNRTMSGKILFVDGGLERESVLAAQLLLARETEAILCSSDQVLEYIKWEIDHFGAGID